ncbi:DUF6928 family protein [Luteipulveratus halotolerans]|uniref:Uncharacterized protein n=1 Tax=Luteipulveratus halotolerans TaxID=1631356 RepID=A0A0L6CK82_9MICO|nr:hypothetical protein [Luteipulveratus halotolerans]KNX38206.1 hypothetical protein VV01_15340 [Luteipulveratus halotolerans]
MGRYSCTALSPHRPAGDLTMLRASDADAALASVRDLLPGTHWSLVRTGRWLSEVCADGEVGVVVCGGTALVRGVDPSRLDIDPVADGLWHLEVQTTSDAYAVRVSTPTVLRSVDLWPGMTDADLARSTTGSPLPPEEPFWAGEHDRPELAGAAVAFDLADYGRAVFEWMFGWDLHHPDAPGSAVDLTSLSLHVFAPGAAPEPTPEQARPEPERRRGLFGRKRSR